MKRASRPGRLRPLFQPFDCRHDRIRGGRRCCGAVLPRTLPQGVRRRSYVGSQRFNPVRRSLLVGVERPTKQRVSYFIAIDATTCRAHATALCLTLQRTTFIVKSRHYRAVRLIRSAYRVQDAQRSATALVVALVFLVQATALGFAFGALADDGLFGAVCARNVQQPLKSSQPGPPPVHHLGACCILHADVYAGDDIHRTAEIARQEPLLHSGPLPAIEIGALRDNAELRPISPRAPPARSV